MKNLIPFFIFSFSCYYLQGCSSITVVTPTISNEQIISPETEIEDLLNKSFLIVHDENSNDLHRITLHQEYLLAVPDDLPDIQQFVISPNGYITVNDEGCDYYPNTGLYLIGNGKKLQITANSWYSEYSPRVSPNGDWIVYALRTGRSQEIHFTDINGRHDSRWLFSAAEEKDPDWSPSGNSIVFTSDIDGDYDLYRLDPDGSITRLTNHPGNDTLPRWSPNGQRIAFVSDRSGAEEIYTMTTQGRFITRITSDQNVKTIHSWSPDGSTLAYLVKNGQGVASVFIQKPGEPSVRLDLSFTPDWLDWTAFEVATQEDGRHSNEYETETLLSTQPDIDEYLGYMNGDARFNSRLIQGELDFSNILSFNSCGERCWLGLVPGESNFTDFKNTLSSVFGVDPIKPQDMELINEFTREFNGIDGTSLYGNTWIDKQTDTRFDVLGLFDTSTDTLIALGFSYRGDPLSGNGLSISSIINQLGTPDDWTYMQGSGFAFGQTLKYDPSLIFWLSSDYPEFDTGRCPTLPRTQICLNEAQFRYQILLLDDEDEAKIDMLLNNLVRLTGAPIEEYLQDFSYRTMNADVIAEQLCYEISHY